MLRFTGVRDENTPSLKEVQRLLPAEALQVAERYVPEGTPPAPRSYLRTPITGIKLTLDGLARRALDETPRAERRSGPAACPAPLAGQSQRHLHGAATARQGGAPARPDR